MSSLDPRRIAPARLLRLAAALALAGLTAGCFEPLYGDKATVGGAGLDNKLANVEVAPVEAPNGSHESRVGFEVRNELLYQLTGGAAAPSPLYRLEMHVVVSQLQVIVDINTARPDIQNYGVDVTYTLVDLKTNKPVIKGQTFSRVSYNIPGQQQRFAGARGSRDAETRAAKEIADNIRNRLATFFVAGT